MLNLRAKGEVRVSVSEASCTVVAGVDKGPQQSWSDVTRVGAVVPVSDPDNKDANMTTWETKIYQLGRAYK